MTDNTEQPPALGRTAQDFENTLSGAEQNPVHGTGDGGEPVNEVDEFIRELLLITRGFNRSVMGLISKYQSRKPNDQT